MTPHPELLRLLAQLVRDVAEVGPEPLIQASARLEYMGWLVRGLQRGEPANDSDFPPESG